MDNRDLGVEMSDIEKNLIKVLKAAVGKDHVLTDQESLSFYSMDVYRSIETPIAVIKPDSAEELQEGGSGEILLREGRPQTRPTTKRDPKQRRRDRDCRGHGRRQDKRS